MANRTETETIHSIQSKHDAERAGRVLEPLIEATQPTLIRFSDETADLPASAPRLLRTTFSLMASGKRVSP